MDMHTTEIPDIDTSMPVFMFSGQGSQKQGMGADLRGEPMIGETLSCASDMFGFDVAALMEKGPVETLNDTRHAQAALVGLSVSLFRVLSERNIQASAVLGFSLGQVSALYAAGILGLEQTFAFAKVRAEAMAEAAKTHPGAMSALLGADEESAQALCVGCAEDEVLVIANYNCPGQIVISGERDAVSRAESRWGEQKKRFARLATAGAFHSPLMEDAKLKLQKYLAGVEFAEPKLPLICNVDAQQLTASRAADHLSRHLTQPVRFQQSVENLLATGASTFVEVGYGAVLIGLVKRIDKSSVRINIESEKSLESFLAQQKEW